MPNKEEEQRMKALEVSIEMMRTIIVQLQMDIHTLKSQQFLRDRIINGK